MISELWGTDDTKWQHATDAVKAALKARINLGNQIAEMIDKRLAGEAQFNSATNGHRPK